MARLLMTLIKYRLLTLLVFIIPTTALTADKEVAGNLQAVSTLSTYNNKANSGKMLDSVQQLLADEDYRAAFVELRQLSKSHRSNPEVWRLLGLAAHKKGDYLRSKVAFEKALKLAPDDKIALGLQSDLYLSMGDKQSARSNLEKLKELCPNGCDSRERIAAALNQY